MIADNHARLPTTNTAEPVKRPRGRALMVVGDCCTTHRAVYDALSSAKAWDSILVIDDPAPTMRQFFLAVAAAADVSIPARMPLIDIPWHVNSSLLRLDVTAIWWVGGCVKPNDCRSAHERFRDLFEIFMRDHGMSLIVESNVRPVDVDVARSFNVVDAGMLVASDIRSIVGGPQ